MQGAQHVLDDAVEVERYTDVEVVEVEAVRHDIRLKQFEELVGLPLGHDQRLETGAFSSSTLRNAHDLAIADEDLARPAPGEANHAAMLTVFQCSLVNGNLLRHQRLDGLSEQASDPAERPVDVCLPPFMVRGYKEIDPARRCRFDEDKATATPSPTHLDAKRSSVIDPEEFLGLGRSEHKCGALHSVQPRGGAKWGREGPVVKRSGVAH